MKKEKADILEGNIPKDILDALLRDHTTQRNIFWATKDYEQWGDGYAESGEITYEKVCDNNKIIPRVLKDTLQQTARSRDMAEVYIHYRTGYIDRTGKEVIPLKYNDAWTFHEGLACVNGGNVIVNRDGAEIKDFGSWERERKEIIQTLCQCQRNNNI